MLSFARKLFATTTYVILYLSSQMSAKIIFALSVSAELFTVHTVLKSNLSATGTNNDKSTSVFIVPTGVWIDWTYKLIISDEGGKVKTVGHKSNKFHTIAGHKPYSGAAPSGDNVPATAPSVEVAPYTICGSSAGELYLVDQYNHHQVRAISPYGIISPFSGIASIDGEFSGDYGPATSAQLNKPSQCAVMSTGDVLVADSDNYRLRLITSSKHIINTYAGSGTDLDATLSGPLTSTLLTAPHSLFIDTNTHLYIGEGDLTGRVRKTIIGSNILTTYSGFVGPKSYVTTGDGCPATSAGSFSRHSVFIVSLNSVSSYVH